MPLTALVPNEASTTDVEADVDQPVELPRAAV
jgi:hypothetical protein